MANYMDINQAGCTLAIDKHPPITCMFYTGTATALNTEATYPWDKTGILSTSAYQLAVPPMIGMLVKWKDVAAYDVPCVEPLATGGNGNLVVGFVTDIGNLDTMSATYVEVSVYMFQPGDLLKLYSSDHGSATIPVFNQAVSFYTGERAWQVDNTNGCGRVIKTPAAKGDDFLLLWVKYGGV